MRCTNPITIDIGKKTGAGIWREVRCKKCLACRITIRKEWSLRLLTELHYYKDNSLFCTLTYDDEHCPLSLNKREIQLFNKRLRQSVRPNKYKFFMCGEYGDKTFRPHYHFLFFGINMSHIDIIMSIWDKCDWSNYHIRNKSFDYVANHNIEYVSGYIHSKLSGPDLYYQYIEQNLEPPFRLSSKHLGMQYIEDNKEQLIEDKSIRRNGHDVPLPEYYRKKLGLTEEDYREIINQSDIETTEKYTGITINSKFLGRVDRSLETQYRDEKNKRNKQLNNNLKSKQDLKKTKGDF